MERTVSVKAIGEHVRITEALRSGYKRPKELDGRTECANDACHEHNQQCPQQTTEEEYEAMRSLKPENGFRPSSEVMFCAV
jgi:hypothetical protein